MVRSCKKGADKVLREQRDAGDDLHQQGWGHSVPRGHLTGFTAVIDCPEWRREGLLHRMAIVRDSEGKCRGWNSYERQCRAGPWDQASDGAVCTGDEEATEASNQEPAQVTVRGARCT